MDGEKLCDQAIDAVLELQDLLLDEVSDEVYEKAKGFIDIIYENIHAIKGDM